MPDFDPLALTPDDLSKEISELRETLGAYDAVRDMAQLAGWPVFIQELEKRSKFWKTRSEELLAAILFERDPGQERQFADARIHYLATEEAILIYLTIREDAKKAKEMLDKMPANVQASTENG